MVIKGTFSKKAYLHLMVLPLLIVLVLFGLQMFAGIEEFSWQIVSLIILGYFVITLMIYIYDVVRPIHKIIEQIMLVLANRKYKKIYTKRTDEVGILAHFFNEVTESLEVVSNQLSENKKITDELHIAYQLQKELIPNSVPTIEGFDIAVKNRSAEELGGDNLDFIKVEDSTYFYIGDITGHGIPAAIMMVMVNTLINAYVKIYNSLYDVVVQTNSQFKKRVKAAMFMSMVIMKWDGIKKQLSYVGCGHEHILIYRAKTGFVDSITTGGIALGMIVDNSKIVKELILDLDANDVLVLYTDGITEARNMAGDMFGLQRLIDVVAQYGGQGGAMEIIQNIAKDFSRFVEEHVQDDDVTLMVLKRLHEGEESSFVIDQKIERWSDENANDNLGQGQIEGQAQDVQSL